MAKIVTPVAAMALVTLVTVSGLRMAVQNLYNQGMMISEQIVSCVDAAGALDTDYTKMQSYTSNVIHEPSEQTIGGYSDALDQAYGRMVKNIEVFKKYANSSKEKETVLDAKEKGALTGTLARGAGKRQTASFVFPLCGRSSPGR